MIMYGIILMIRLVIRRRFSSCSVFLVIVTSSERSLFCSCKRVTMSVEAEFEAGWFMVELY